MPSTARYDVFISYTVTRTAGWRPHCRRALSGSPSRGTGCARCACSGHGRARGQPRLWGTIEAALRDSGWLILLASPEAAQSSSLDREVAWWLADKSADRMLIAAITRAALERGGGGIGRARRSRLRSAAHPGVLVVVDLTEYGPPDNGSAFRTKISPPCPRRCAAWTGHADRRAPAPAPADDAG